MSNKAKMEVMIIFHQRYIVADLLRENATDLQHHRNI